MGGEGGGGEGRGREGEGPPLTQIPGSAPGLSVQPVPRAVHCCGFRENTCRNCLQRGFDAGTSRTQPDVLTNAALRPLPQLNSGSLETAVSVRLTLARTCSSAHTRRGNGTAETDRRRLHEPHCRNYSQFAGLCISSHAYPLF